MGILKPEWKRVCLTLPTALIDEIQLQVPGSELSPKISLLLDYAWKAGFVVRLSDIQPEGSKYGVSPVLRANAAQMEFARHAFRYICLAAADTADDALGAILEGWQTAINESSLTADAYELLIDHAYHHYGWDGSSQDDAPIPKAGTPHPKHSNIKPSRASRVQSRVDKNLAIAEVVSPDATTDDEHPDSLEEFGFDG